MAIPDQVTVPSGTHVQRFVPASFIANSISVLNPNDGVCWIARNRDCLSTTIGAWDWKVPSQSYAYLPGPFQSVGILYTDASGAALPGQISTYASETKLDWPHFQAIGRAQVYAVTTLDIGMGNQPSNPATNSVRLWADGNGDLHILSSGGSDNLVYDSSNIGAVALGGDLNGTIGNAHVAVRYNDFISFYYSDGSSQRAYQPVNLDNYIFTGKSGRMYFWSDNPPTNLGSWDAPSNTLLVNGLFQVNSTALINSTLTCNGEFHGNTIRAGDIYANRGDGTGVYYFAGGSDKYLYFSGSGYLFGGSYPVTTGGNVTVGAALTIAGNQLYINTVGLSTATARGYGALMTNTGQGDFILGGGQSIIYMHPNLSVYLQQNYPVLDVVGYGGVRSSGSFIASNGYFYFNTANTIAIYTDGTYIHPTHSLYFNTVGNQVLWPNGSYISGNAGYVQGSNPALKHSLSAVPDDALLGVVSDPRMPISTYIFDGETRRNIGFMADDVADVLGDFVLRDDNGSPAGYVPQELATILWGAVRALKARVDDLSSRLPA